MPRIRGRIVRIPDEKTVVINLGKDDGIQSDSIFSILGELEAMVDPQTGEELGMVNIVKGKVKAAEVYQKFTIGVSRWTEFRYSGGPFGGRPFGFLGTMGYELVEHGKALNIDSQEIEPWKALAESPVRVGDAVEVEVRGTLHKDEEEDQQESPATASGSENG